MTDSGRSQTTDKAVPSGSQELDVRLEPLLRDVPEEKRTEFQRKLHSILQVSAYSYSGDMIPPEMLREMNDVVPGSAQQFLESYYREQAHRHRIEDSFLQLTQWRTRTGLKVGALSFAALLAAVLGCAALGSTGAAVGLCGVAVTGVIGVMIDGKRRAGAQQQSSPDQETRP